MKKISLDKIIKVCKNIGQLNYKLKNMNIPTVYKIQLLEEGYQNKFVLEKYEEDDLVWIKYFSYNEILEELKAINKFLTGKEVI